MISMRIVLTRPRALMSPPYR
eukprot:COSAG02_NODE_17868_length_974_cov_35.181714_1_plen_20_part_10